MLNPDTLWTTVKERTLHALQCGALQPVPTSVTWVEQDGVRFLVRCLTNLVRKDEAKKQQQQAIAAGKAANPFLPYDANLFVTHITDTHVCLLNKFNVVDHHLLIVTRAFEDQERLLTQDDFAATGLMLMAIDGLIFYNGGRQAGASQPHKHLQLVPLPLTPEGDAVPIAPLLMAIQGEAGRRTIPQWPFVHAIAPLDPDWLRSPSVFATEARNCYHTLLHRVGLLPPDPNTDPWQVGPYNLLITRKWMLLVPRSQEDCEGIPVNALGFAGALLVRNPEQMQRLQELTPMTVLKWVAIVQE